MGRIAADLHGQAFGRLIVERRSGSVSGSAAWRCLCTCGRRCTVRAGSLINGSTTSCGCARRDASAARMASLRNAGRMRYTADEIIAQTFAADPRELMKRLGIRVPVIPGSEISAIVEGS